MKNFRTPAALAFAVFSSVGLIGLTGCEQDTVDDATDAINDAAEDTSDAMNDAGEEIADEIDDATDDQ